MNSRDLKKWQLEKMRDDLGPAMRYLNRMIKRMSKVGFPGNDRLYLEAMEARDALVKLTMSMHYLGCDPGTVGHPQQRESDSTNGAGAVE